MDHVIEVIQNMGRSVEKRWKRQGYSEEKFSEICESVLSESRVSEILEPKPLIECLLKDQLTSQQYRYSFSDLQIKLFESNDFYIEVLFWRNGTTSVHDHMFSGAFTLLCGKSIHTTYVFEEKEKIRDGFRIGSLQTKSIELLTEGQVRQIMSGRKLIHSVFHLSNPSISLLIRTKKESASLPQLDYRRPGIAIDPTNTSQTIKKKMEALDFLYKSGANDFYKMLNVWVDNATIEEIYRILDFLAPYAREDKKLLSALESLISCAPHRNILGESLLAKLEEFALIALRTKSTCPDTKLLLGVILVSFDGSNAIQILRDLIGEEWSETAFRVIATLESRGSMKFLGPMMKKRLYRIMNG